MAIDRGLCVYMYIHMRKDRRKGREGKKIFRVSGSHHGCACFIYIIHMICHNITFYSFIYSILFSPFEKHTQIKTKKQPAYPTAAVAAAHALAVGPVGASIFLSPSPSANETNNALPSFLPFLLLLHGGGV